MVTAKQMIPKRASHGITAKKCKTFPPQKAVFDCKILTSSAELVNRPFLGLQKALFGG